ncbi:MAG: transketolase family protein [Actinomycetia bacterium]|nr:transketolase family protein [Actinomycetes bacterium]
MSEALVDCRDTFARTLIELAAADPRIVVVVNDSIGSSNLGSFQAAFPDRVVNVGIAEQAMVGVSAGLAAAGKIPFVSGAACFLTGRATEQLKIDVAYSRAGVKLCGQAPGMAYGELGPTHHSIEDLSWLRAMPGLTVIVPADPGETAAALRWMAATDGPAYVRIPRLPVPVLPGGNEPFTPGRGRVVRDGGDVSIIATGVVVHRALAAADVLAQEGIEARVVSMPCVSPLDDDLVVACARQTGRIVTAEEALISGGLGAGVARVVVERHPVPMRLLGMDDTLAPTGSETWLLEWAGLSAEGIARAVSELLDDVGPRAGAL